GVVRSAADLRLRVDDPRWYRRRRGGVVPAWQSLAHRRGAAAEPVGGRPRGRTDRHHGAGRLHRPARPQPPRGGKAQAGVTGVAAATRAHDVAARGTGAVAMTQGDDVAREGHDTGVAPYVYLLVTMALFGSAFTSSKIVVGQIPHDVAGFLRF